MLQKLFMPESKRATVFWRFFSSFFVFILVPSILASLFTYVYVVRLVEREMEKSSEIVIGHFAGRTDELLGTLQNDMIKLLGYSGLDRFLREQDESTDSLTRNEQLGAFLTQMEAMVANHPLAHRAYLLLTGHDLVIDPAGSFDKSFFFMYRNRFPDLSQERLQAMFTGKKMMEFTNPQVIEQTGVYSEQALSSGRFTSAVISYPFNSDQPKAYLVVNIDTEQLRQQIEIRHSGAFETAILSNTGELLAYTGAGELDNARLMETVASGNTAKTNIEAGDRVWQMLSHYSGSHDWIYVGLTDIKELNRPGTRIQQASIILLLFFLLAGAILSYLVSKKMYTPIRDIKNELESGRRRAGLPHAEQGNELDLIRQWSKLLVTENKDMSVLINGMTPVMHEYFLGKVLLGELRDDLSIMYYAKEIGFNADPGCNLAVLCIEVQYYERADSPVTETGKSYLMIDLKNKLERLLADTVWLCQLRKDLLVCILHMQQHDPRTPVDKAKDVAVLLEQQMEHYRSTIGVGTVVSAVSELHQSYRHALRLLRYKGLDQAVQICIEQGEADERSTFDSFLPAEYVNQMLNWYKIGDYATMLERVLELIDNGERSNATADAVRQLSVDVLNTWLRAVASDNKHEFSIEQYSGLFQRLEDCATWADIRRFFREAADELFVAVIEESRQDQFEDVAAYIRNHYSDDMSIEQLASRLNMSVGHFSRSFKEAVGDKYIDYLTRCRIEAAKRLLLETDRKIDDIAAEVGYLGRNSFIKTFRKLEGITPGKYREAYRSSEE